MSFDALLPFVLLVPAITAAIAAIGSGAPGFRDAASIVGALVTTIIVWSLVWAQYHGIGAYAVLATPLEGFEIALRPEPLGLTFAAMASTLWLISSVYTSGFISATQDERPGQLQACFALSVGAALGLALASNLLTLFVFYEALTLSTVPLVAHKRNDVSIRAARFYFGVLVAASFTLLLPAIVYIQYATGSQDFVPGGIMLGKVDPGTASILLIMVVFGCAKAALIPLHAWLPAAMVAPAPVSALLHAVAVVKAGAFAILKISLMIFGPALVSQTVGAQIISWIAISSIIIASAVALTKDDLKARLAWSTIAQLAAITLGAMMASPAGALGAALQLVGHGVAKITLFFGAGVLASTYGVHRVSQLGGLGRRAPALFLAMTLAAFSIVGLPPLIGFWSKFELASGAMSSGQIAIGALLVASSMLTLTYLGAIPARAFTPGSDKGRFPAEWRTNPLMLAATVATGAICVLLFLAADPVARFVMSSMSGVGNAE
jgi:multicomponent Na+:H+ antiporter subunit D